eukprot:scaffold5122_cov60-Attheya_sp.AAC.4
MSCCSPRYHGTRRHVDVSRLQLLPPIVLWPDVPTKWYGHRVSGPLPPQEAGRVRTLSSLRPGPVPRTRPLRLVASTTQENTAPTETVDPRNSHEPSFSYYSWHRLGWIHPSAGPDAAHDDYPYPFVVAALPAAGVVKRQ